ncbi:MAG: hypothetical protein H8D23_04740 [Candidatus Brocadiales bacterium]|nr:hypothetical protein [Candidatus Brocadiales bacterium]
MAPDQVDQLDQIGRDIKTLITQDTSGMNRKEFWGGIILAVIINLAAISYGVGQFQATVDGHISDKAIHLSAEQQKDFVQNTAHTKEYTRDKLDEIYVSHNEVLEVILDKTNKQNQNDDN